MFVVLAGLIAVSIALRIYGMMRGLGGAVSGCARGKTIAVNNARVDLGRELVILLKVAAPTALSNSFQLFISLSSLLSFSTVLSSPEAPVPEKIGAS